jgi:hypothetical protein
MIIFPIFVLMLVSVISVIYENPIATDTEGSITDIGGKFIYNDYNQVKWYNNATGKSYFVVDLSGVSIDPRIDTAEPFKIANTDTGDMEYYDNYADFLVKKPTQKVTSSTNLFDSDILWGIVFLALGVGVAVGVTVLGTGISEWAQRLVFLASIWGGVWLFLTSVSAKILFVNNFTGIYGSLAYLALTLMFVFGLALHVSGDQ